ncbi:MAG TPA: SGNH/GDSL hydrolase family protein [Edaphobacter sp.]|jgi:lysophospholipase L1-like esterase
MWVKVRAALLVCLAGSWLSAGDAWAQAAGATATVESPGRVAMMEAKLADWPQLARYRAANAALAPAAEGEDRVVFFGASMTEFWGKYGTKFFPGKPYVNRGISGQTTAQMVVRFRQDVIDLHPKAVVILGGTNDVAGNTGLMTPEMTEDNWQSMADLAKANGIRVIFASITPSTDFWWHKGLKPAEKIRTLNAWLKAYCESHGLTYLDYYSTLTDEEGGMKKEFTVDGVHATAKGYAVMAPLAQAAIDEALAK